MPPKRTASRGSPRSRLKTAAGTGLSTWMLYPVVLLVLLLYLCFYTQYAVHISENILYFIHPTADRAFAYGENHFDDTNPQAYDINRAEFYFKLADAQNPRLPYVNHELARIAFLQGDFTTALAYINVQIEREGDTTPNSYYVRGLIEGFMGDYLDAERDYAHFLTFDPFDWAGINDYVWVLLKDKKPREADAQIAAVLPYAQNNPWLLNSDAIALFELGDTRTARSRIAQAAQAVSSLDSTQWSHAYPGNDPSVAPAGLAAFKAAVSANMHSIDSGSLKDTVQ